MLSFLLLLASGSSWTDARPHSRRDTLAKSFDLNIGEFLASPDGVVSNVQGINGVIQYPIVVNLGDEVAVKAINHLSEPTTIHFHGMKFEGVPWLDGASGYSQCPIAPGASFEYRWTPKQSGTYWYHSHHRAQYVKGVRGPFIIQDPNDPYLNQYDEEVVVMLTDWYHGNSSDTLLDNFLDDTSPNAGNEPIPDSGLVNGKGSYNCSKITDGTPCQSNPLEMFHFEPLKRYRLRIINGGSMATFNFSIDGHTLDVIEADGVPTARTTVDSLRIAVAQRYSVIVTANANPSNYWMRADIDVSQYSLYTQGILDPSIRAIVSYDGSFTTPNSTQVATPVKLDPYALLALDPTPAPDGTAFYSMHFHIGNNATNYSVAQIEIDGAFDYSPLKMPPPGQYALQNIGNWTMNTVGTSINAVPVQAGTVVDIVIYNDDPTEHIFHLHGHNFWVIRHGLQLSSTPATNGTGAYPVRDTIQVPPCKLKDPTHSGDGLCGGTLGLVQIRFVANNPGAWLFHCHMAWHHEQGLGMTWLTLPQPNTTLSIPNNIQDLCKPYL